MHVVREPLEVKWFWVKTLVFNKRYIFVNECQYVKS